MVATVNTVVHLRLLKSSMSGYFCLLLFDVIQTKWPEENIETLFWWNGEPWIYVHPLMSSASQCDVSSLNDVTPTKTVNLIFGPFPGSFLFIFGLFKETNSTFLQHINVKNVHTLYGAIIRTHDLLNTRSGLTSNEMFSQAYHWYLDKWKWL